MKRSPQKPRAARAAPKTLTDFHKDIDLISTAELQFDNQQVGVHILGQNGKPKQLQFVLGFDTHGVAPLLNTGHDSAQAEQQAQRWDKALAALPSGVTFTIHTRKTADDTARQHQLNQKLQQIRDDIQKLEAFSRKKRIHDLTRTGHRQQIDITLYATYTVDAAQSMGNGLWEKILRSLENSMRSDAKEVGAVVLHQQLHHVYYDGYQALLNYFAQMGITVTPLNAEQLYQRSAELVSGQFKGDPLGGKQLRGNRAQQVRLPQLVTVDETGLREQVRSTLHPAVYLTRHGLPEAHPAYIKRVTSQGTFYTGVVTPLDKKPEGWASSIDQMAYLFTVLAHPSVKDTEVVVQFTKADSAISRMALQLHDRQSKTQMARAEEQGATDVASMVTAADSVEAQLQLMQGDVPIQVGMAMLVHRSNLRDVAMACNQVISLFGDTWMIRDSHRAYQTWLQTLPVTRQKLLHYQPFDQRQLYFSSEAVAFMSGLVKPQPHDRDGIELIAEQGGVPFHLNFVDSHPLLSRRMLGVYGTTRSGKSLFTAQVLFEAYTQGIPVTILDVPKEGGDSTFSDFTRLLGGSYVEVMQESLNFLELPNVFDLAPEEQEEHLQEFAAEVSYVLNQLVLSNTPAEQLPVSMETIKSVLQLALHRYCNDPILQERTRLAHQQGSGSAAWQDMPTLHDFITLLTPETIQDNSADVATAIDYCRLRLNAAVKRPGVGRAISQPSSLDASAQLMVFAFTKVQDPEDAAIFAMIANIVATRRALTAPSSILFIDESPILLQFEQFSLMVGRKCANGAKAGISVMLAAQDPDSIATSKAGQQILQNLNTQIVGRIQRPALPSFERYLNIPQETLAANASPGFFPNPTGMYSNWLVSDAGTYTAARFYPSPILLALTVNNPEEQAARTQVMEQFSKTPDGQAQPNGQRLEGIAKFAQLLTQSLQAGQSITAVVNTWLEQQTETEASPGISQSPDPTSF